MKKKILLLTPDFPPMTGGVARYLSFLSKFLSEDIEVVAKPHTQWKQFDSTAGYDIYRRRLLRSWGPWRWWRSVRYMRQYAQRYRLVLTSHVLPFGTAAMMAARKTKIPYIVFVHGMDIRLAQASARKRRTARKVLNEARLVVCNSQALAQEVIRVFGVSEILVVYPCIQEIPKVEAKTVGSKSSFNILTVARLVDRKGHVHVLNALANLRGAGKLREFHYHIVGDGPMRSSLEQMVRALSLGGHVTFHGMLNDDELSTQYARSDIFVMPVSNDPVDKEGFGLVFIEAASYGVPSISTNIVGVNEAVIDRETGVLLESQDEELLAEAMLTLAKDEAFRERLGAAAKERARGFTCEQQISKLRPYLI